SLGQRREPLLELLQAWLLTELLAEQEFAVDQVEAIFEVVCEGGVPRQVDLGAHLLAFFPGGALLGPQGGDKESTAAGRREEGLVEGGAGVVHWSSCSRVCLGPVRRCNQEKQAAPA